MTTAQPWSGTRVVDLTGLTGAYGGRVWAALGADVIAVEPPGGSSLRRLTPLAPGVDAPENGLWWAYYGAGKQSVVLDPALDGDRLAALLATADVVLDDAPPTEQDRPVWGRSAVQALNPGVSWVSVTPFGMTGPRRNWNGSDLVGWASCGVANTIGFADRAPVAPAPELQVLAHVTSMNAVIAAMLAVRARRRTGTGQTIDISMQEVGLSFAPETGVPLYLDDQVERPRAGNRRPITSPMGLFPCQDGFVAMIAIQPSHWTAVAHWVNDVCDNEGILEEIFLDMVVRREAMEAIDLWIEDLTNRFTKLELFVEGQKRGIPVTPVNTVDDLRSDPHLEATGWWRTEEHPALGSYTVPGSPFSTPDDWWAWTRAPMLGEHTASVMQAIEP